MFQLLEQGFAGIVNGVTMLEAKDAKTGERCVVLAVYRPGIEQGTFNVEPIARLLTDPSEVTEPTFEHTDGAGNEKEEAEAAGSDDNSGKPNRNRGNGKDH